MAIVIFDPAAFLARYPEFATLTTAQLQGCFDDATLYLNNTDCSVVQDVTQRAQLLNMLTAHIAALSYGVNGAGASPFVGRITSASEGSVSISADSSGFGAGSAWYLQTRYGALYWQATLPWRQARYYPAVRWPYGCQ